MTVELDSHLRLHARQEYLSPGEPETVARLADVLGAMPDALVLEVACGKGEAARVLAHQAGCRVLALDLHLPFVRYARKEVLARDLSDAVHVIRGDGRRVPAADGAFDAGYCIGGPSIVGLEACLRELHRTVRPGGVVVVSDLYWRHVPTAPLGPEWGWMTEVADRRSLDEYRDALERAGLAVEEVAEHGDAAWEAYFRPMLAAAAEERRRGETAFAEQVERDVALERRGVAAFHGYMTMVARARPA